MNSFPLFSFSLSNHWWTPSSLYTLWWFIPIKQFTSIIFSTHNIWNHFRCFSESPWINLATSEHYAVIWQLASLLMYVKFVCHEALLWNWNPQFYEHLIFLSHITPSTFTDSAAYVTHISRWSNTRLLVCRLCE